MKKKKYLRSKVKLFYQYYNNRVVYALLGHESNNDN